MPKVEEPLDNTNEDASNPDRGKEVLNVLPLGKWKRVLLFLGDFFVAFIIAIFLSNIVAYPIAKASTNYDNRLSNQISQEQDRYAILYDNRLLYYETAETKNDINSNLEYTYKLFLSYYVTGEHPEYEVFSNYYSIYENQNDLSLVELYGEYDSLEMFDLNEIPELKEDFKAGFAPLFDERNEMTDQFQTYYDQAFSHFFLSVFYNMINDVKANDLSSPDGTPTRSYNELTVMIEGFDEFEANLTVLCASISLGVSCVVCYFVYPLLNKSGRTVTGSILKVDRVGRSSFRILNRPVRLLIGLYLTVLSLPGIVFVPIPTVSINAVFSISPLVGVSTVGLVLVLAALLCVIIDKYNRGFTELSTHSVCLKEEMLDEIYKAKGYYV